LRDPDTYARIGQAYRAIVFDSQTGKSEEISIHLIDGEAKDWASSDAVGTAISFVYEESGYYNIATK